MARKCGKCGMMKGNWGDCGNCEIIRDEHQERHDDVVKRSVRSDTFDHAVGEIGTHAVWKCVKCCKLFSGSPAPWCSYCKPKDDMKPLKAHEILGQSAYEMRDRGKTYDKPEGERSMGATVAAFKAITGITMTEQQGWQFMEILKLVRSNQGGYRADSFIDGAAYAALAGEAAARNKSDVIANG